jgi:putative heme transporter
VTRYRLSISFVSALLVIVAVAAAVVLAGVVSAASRPLGWAVASGIVALLLESVVAFFARRLPHWLAVVVSLVLVVVVLAGTWIGASATLADNIDEIRAEAPIAAAELEARYQVAQDFELQRRVSSFVDELDERLGAKAQVQRGASTVPTYAVTGVLMVFFLIYGPRFVSGGLAQIDDPVRRERMRVVIDRTVEAGRGYLLLSLARAIIITLIAWPAFALIGLNASFLLGLIVGGLSVVPSLGIILGGLPAMLIAAAFAGVDGLAWVVVLVVVLQLVDGFVVQPRIDTRTLRVGPAAPLIVGLIGWELYGLGGAIYGVALLVLLLALARAVSTDDDGTDVVVAGMAARPDDRAGGAGTSPARPRNRGITRQRDLATRALAARRVVSSERCRRPFGLW